MAISALLSILDNYGGRQSHSKYEFCPARTTTFEKKDNFGTFPR